jgi:hypothetical protein
MFFDEFREMLSGWMENGRFVWYFTGNYDHQGAIELVGQIREKFGKHGMKNADIENLPKVTIAKLEPGTSILVE